MKTTGTIIGRYPLTETSLIIHWCTADSGLLKTVAKGARRPKSPFAGKVDLFFRCEIEIYPSKRSDLHTLREIAVLDNRLGLRKTYQQTLAGSYFVKLIEKVAEPETPVPELEDLLNRGLNYLEDHAPDHRAVRHFEKQLSEILGIATPGTEPVELLREQIAGAYPTQREELYSRMKS